LYLGAYGNFIQLGYAPDPTGTATDVVDIPWSLIKNYIVKANTGNTVAPKQTTIAELKGVLNTTDAIKWTATLISIDSAEFISADLFSTYAVDPNISSGVNKTIKDCSNAQLVIRMSSYANYRNAIIPDKRGPVTAIFSRFNTTPQLLIRDTTDLKMTGTRCDGVVVLPPAIITIDSLRKLYPDTSSTQVITLGNYEVHGTVISSYKDSNISNSSVSYMQDGSGRGINIFGISGLQLGDSISIKLNGHQLIVYNGSLEIKKGTSGSLNRTLIQSNRSVVPKVLTIAEFNADINNKVYNQRKYESTLVRFEGVTISGSPTTSFSGNKTVSDGANSVIMYSRNAPPFSTTALPTGPVNVTAIGLAYKNSTTQPVSIPELYLRKLPDDIN
jgi:hypothetical protein